MKKHTTLIVAAALASPLSAFAQDKAVFPQGDKVTSDRFVGDVYMNLLLPEDDIYTGDVVKIPANVKHWHGGRESTSMTHLFVIPNTEKGGSVWFEPVSEENFSE